VALIAGNGLTIDLLASAPAGFLDAWHPGRPLHLNLYDKDDPSIKLIDSGWFPNFNAGVYAAKARLPGASDFELIRQGFEHVPAKARMPYLEEARRYLVLSYSHFQRAVERCWTGREHWRWTQWLVAHRESLAFIVSFNYDLTLERALEAAAIPYGEVGLFEPGIPMLKPHSSIDHGSAVLAGPTNRIIMCDFPQRRLAATELLDPRVECNLILPAEPTNLRDHQTVAPGFTQFRELAPSFSHVVIAGISYWDVDRPEIDEFLDCLPRTTTAVVANPNPPQDLESAILARGLQCEKWTCGPQPIQSGRLAIVR
jgi:hypothetical protein